MKHKKFLMIIIALLIVILGTATLFSTGILIFNGRNAKIELPDVGTVTQVEMGRMYDWGIQSGGVFVSDRSEIEEILTILGEARKPVIVSFLYWSRFANEVPSNRTHISVSFGGSPIFLYTQENSGYAYIPYIGLYQINTNAIDKLIRLYENHEPEWRTNKQT